MGAATRTSVEAPPTPSTVDYRGQTFGNYTILEEVSRGAMGVVYKARQHHLNRIVALKVLIAGDLATEAQVARFRREAQAAARLRHPAIVPIHEVGAYQGKHFFTMDYIEGRNLGDLLHAGEITTRRALDIAAQVADALDYAHGEGIIHRDIKPSNIMIDDQGRIHIMDFGLAKQLDSDTKFTRTGTTIGTPAYMPPEQASGGSRGVDHRADIYSLGAVLYELLTRRPPFGGDSMMNTLMHVLNDEPMPPKRVNPRIHRDIQTIVLKAMEKSPERRYPTMRALADDIRRFIAGESITARPAGVLYRAWRVVKRHHSAVFAAASVVVIGLAALAAVLEIRRQGELRTKMAFETGKRKGAQDVEKKLELQEKPTKKMVFEDDFRSAALGDRWVPEEGPWQIAADGQLEVAAGPHAAIYTKGKFTGNVTVRFEATVPPNPDGSPQPGALIGCFIGRKWGDSYRVSFGERDGPHLALTDPRQEVARVQCPPLRPATWYRVTFRRAPFSLHVLVESDAGEAPLELSYDELSLPRQLRREFAAGLFTKNTRLRVSRFSVEQEFPPAKLSPTKAAESLFRDDNIVEARSQYEKIAQGYEGRYEGLAALLGIAQCDEAERRLKEAVDSLVRIEETAPGVRHPKLAELLDWARLRRFSASAGLNNFSDAVAALARIAASNGHVDEACVWHLPRHVGTMLTNRAYDEALALLRLPIFGTQRQTLYALVQARRAASLDRFFVERVRQLADGLCNNGQYQAVKDAYEAYPTENLADAFARAATEQLRRNKLDEALSLLAFAQAHQLGGAPLSQAAVDLAGQFCATGAYERLAELYSAVPDPGLASVFRRAIRETTDAKRLEAAFTILQLTLAHFPSEARKLLGPDGPAIRLGKAFVARGDLLQPITIHTAFDPAPNDPSLLALFVEAANKAIDEKKTDESLRLLEHGGIHFGVLHKELAAAAARLVELHAASGDYEGVASAYLAYPNESLAPAVAKAIAAATAAGRPREALMLFGHYARKRQPIPPDAVRALADSIATRDPEREEAAALVDEYRRVCELYESPVARSTFLLALGDAYLRSARQQQAMAQYEAAGDIEGMVRAACITLELGHTERAAALWQRIRALAEKDPQSAAIAAFMSHETSAAAFAQAAQAAKLPPQLVHYLVGLRLWADEDEGAEEELAKAAGDPGAWFAPLAKRARSPRPPADEGP